MSYDMLRNTKLSLIKITLKFEKAIECQVIT